MALGDMFQTILLGIILIWRTYTHASACDQRPADIVFVLDASDSVGAQHFYSQLEIVEHFTSGLNISSSAARVSLVTFSDHVNNVFYLNDVTNVSSLQDAVYNATYIGGGSNLAEALRFVNYHSFQAENGGRGLNVSKFVVVLTDGHSSNSFKTAAEASKLQNGATKVLAIGIGPNVSLAELSTIASDATNVLVLNSTYLNGTMATSAIENALCGPTAACDSQPIDLVFILDSSTSLGVDLFRLAKTFVTQTVQKLNIRQDNVRVGLVTYTSTGKNEFYLNSHTDKASLLSAIANVRFRSGTSATSAGLQQVDFSQFVPYHGARLGPRQIAVLLTDGRSDDTSATMNEAYNLKGRGIEIVTVGLGPTVSQHELDSIATDGKHTLVLSGYDALARVGEKVNGIMCNERQQKLIDTSTADCGDKMADIVFVLDSSASEGADNFMRQVNFVRDFVSHFNISPTAVQVSIVTFSSSVHEEFSLARWADKSSLLSGLNSVSYRPGSTHTGDALRYVRQHSFTTTKGGRKNAESLVVVITDGRSSDPSRTAAEAKLLKQAAHVISIGIGVGVDRMELQHIATDSNHALSVANFDALQMLSIELSQMVCKNTHHV